MLVTGKFKHGKFDHKLPKELADLLDDLSRALRQHGGNAIHRARLAGTPSADPSSDGTDRPKGAHDLEYLVHHMNGAYRHSRELLRRIQTLVAHAEDVDDYEDGPKGCMSCERNAGHWEPAEENRRYCRWCRGFRTEFNADPPLAILDARHRGIRITTAMLKAHGVSPNGQNGVR